MRIKVLSIGFCLLLSSSVWAFSPAVIGGVRDGLALGIMADEGVAKNVGLRFGVEADTGKNPLILFFGGKFYLMNVGKRYPMSLGLGLIGYLGGSKSEAGVSISLIFDKAFDIKPLFIEAGIDVAGSGKLQL
jgi:hypothetical protein